MRVHLGSDHAGLELKDHLLGVADRPRSRGGGPRSVRLRRPRRLPGVLPAGRRGRRRGPGRGPGSLGVVIGGSGNGEQIAANKVIGVRARWSGPRRPPCWPASTTTPTWSRSAGACTPLEEMTRFVEVFLGHRRSPARSGTPAGSRCSATTRPPRPAAAPASALLGGAAPDRMPEGHTLRRLADDLDRDVRRPDGPGEQPQGRFAADAALLDGQMLGGGRLRRQAPLRGVPR